MQWVSKTDIDDPKTGPFSVIKGETRMKSIYLEETLEVLKVQQKTELLKCVQQKISCLLRRTKLRGKYGLRLSRNCITKIPVLSPFGRH